MATAIKFTSAHAAHIELVDSFNRTYDMQTSLLTPDKSAVDKQAVALRAWFFYLNRLAHRNACLAYGQDEDDNLLVATESAYLVAEEELSAHVGELLIALF